LLADDDAAFPEVRRAQVDGVVAKTVLDRCLTHRCRKRGGGTLVLFRGRATEIARESPDGRGERRRRFLRGRACVHRVEGDQAPFRIEPEKQVGDSRRIGGSGDFRVDVEAAQGAAGEVVFAR
jgi:hypothetical protein